MDIRVAFYGNGFDLQSEVVKNCRSSKAARQTILARYAGVKVAWDQVEGGGGEERDYSDWGKCQGERNQHGNQTVPASTWERQEQQTQNGGGTTTTGGRIVSGGTLLVLGAIGAAALLVTGNLPAFVGGFAEGFNGATTENVRQAPATRVAPTTAPTVADRELSACEQWAAAFPALASELQPGDACYAL